MEGVPHHAAGFLALAQVCQNPAASARISPSRVRCELVDKHLRLHSGSRQQQHELSPTYEMAFQPSKSTLCVRHQSALGLSYVSFRPGSGSRPPLWSSSNCRGDVRVDAWLSRSTVQSASTSLTLKIPVSLQGYTMLRPPSTPVKHAPHPVVLVRRYQAYGGIRHK